MSEKIECPVCGRKLKMLNMSHINSKFHQTALKKKGIDPDDDPALELVGDSVTSETEKDFKNEPTKPKAPPKIQKPPKATTKPKKVEKLKIDLPPLKVKRTKKDEPKLDVSKSSAKQESEMIYASEEDFELDIPLIPEPPKKKINEGLNSTGLSVKLVKKMEALESNDVKVVLSRCRRCDGVIPVPIPKDRVLKSELPVVPISYIHKNPEDKDIHCITLHLDHDFDIRRQKISDVVIDEDILLKKNK